MLKWKSVQEPSIAIFFSTYVPFPCDTGMVKKVETVLSSDDGIVDKIDSLS